WTSRRSPPAPSNGSRSTARRALFARRPQPRPTRGRCPRRRTAARGVRSAGHHVEAPRHHRMGVEAPQDAPSLLDDLNPVQREAVAHEGGPLLVVADLLDITSKPPGTIEWE